jgi:hypothetical protein
VNDDSYISPGWDRFFVLGGASEGSYYADWFNDDGKRYDAGVDEYMTDLISNRSIAWMTKQIANKYVVPSVCWGDRVRRRGGTVMEGTTVMIGRGTDIVGVDG